MDWVVDFVASVDPDSVRLIRETLEAKLKAEAGQYGEAARVLWELLVQVRHAKDRQWECITMVHMGKVYRALRWRIAEQLFEDGLELADEIQFTRAKMMCLAELGEMKCQWGQFDDALDLFSKAMVLLEEGDMESRRLLMLDMVVANGIPICIVSDYPPHDKLRKMGFMKYEWAAIINGEEIGELKPSPAGLQAAMKAMGTKPEETLHVGDSVGFDVRGAKNAGMMSAWLKWWWNLNKYDILPDYTFHDFAELMDILEKEFGLKRQAPKK